MAKIWLQIVVSLIFLTIAMGRKVMWYFSFLCHLSILKSAFITDEISFVKMFVISRKWKTIFLLAVLRMWRGERRRGQLSWKRALGRSPGEPLSSSSSSSSSSPPSSSSSWSSELESYYEYSVYYSESDKRVFFTFTSEFAIGLRLGCTLLKLDTGGMWRQILWTSSRGAPPLR